MGNRSHEEVLEYNRNYRRKNRERILIQRQIRRRYLRNEVIRKLGSKCVCCGENEHTFLQVDHIFGNGNKHRKSLVAKQYWREILNDPDILLKYRILCANCNYAHAINGGCPHKGVI